MRCVVQRVSSASVEVAGQIVGQIQAGMVLLLGVEDGDTEVDIRWLSSKIVQIRIFPDDKGVMNRSIIESGGAILLISQFTLLASTRKGTRPSWHRAAKPDIVAKLFSEFHRTLETDLGSKIPIGVFGAHMNVNLTNDGPVTLVIDSRSKE